jgi:hypothetical protein
MRGATAPPAQEAYLGRHQRQVRDCSGQQELAERLRSADVASLARSQLHGPRQSVLGDLPQRAVGSEGVASLEGAGFLEQGLLRVQHYQPSPPRPSPQAGWPERTGRAAGGIEPERPQRGIRRPVALARTD